MRYVDRHMMNITVTKKVSLVFDVEMTDDQIREYFEDDPPQFFDEATWKIERTGEMS